jgi:hypothetical protein
VEYYSDPAMISEGCLETKGLNRMSNGLTRHLGAANGGAGSPQGRVIVQSDSSPGAPNPKLLQQMI